MYKLTSETLQMTPMLTSFVGISQKKKNKKTTLESYLSILSYSIYGWVRFTCFDPHPIVIIRYDEKRSNRKKR
jgi:hypothetical protein